MQFNDIATVSNNLISEGAEPRHSSSGNRGASAAGLEVFEMENASQFHQFLLN